MGTGTNAFSNMLTTGNTVFGFFSPLVIFICGILLFVLVVNIILKVFKLPPTEFEVDREDLEALD